MKRILIIDDNKAIHKDFYKILCAHNDEDAELDAMEESIFDDNAHKANVIEYDIVSAHQGEEGVTKVRESLEADEPYALAFVDMRMPPGIDGLETIDRIWQIDPEIQIVICTAYSDYSWSDIVDRFGHTDRLLILKKPFDSTEIYQLASALTEKWALARQATLRVDEMEQLVLDRTAQLQQTNDQLQIEICNRQEAEEKLRHDSLHDHLTNLPNRALLQKKLTECLERAKRQTNYHFAVLFMDLDNFKRITDCMGHEAGDELLRQTGRRLESCLRLLDTAVRPLNDTSARLGGDEFVVLLDGLSDAGHAQIVADRLRCAICVPVEFENHQFSVGISIGIATSDNDYDDAASILRDADTALYHAKEHGKGICKVFDSKMRDRMMHNHRLESELCIALENNQLQLMYQPIISLHHCEIEGFETLIRWEHPDLGLISPLEFIPIAEQTGMIIPIGLWVMKTACRQLREWHEQFPDQAHLTMSVNLSAKQLIREDLPEQIDAILEEVGIDAKYIKLEVTESIMMQNIDASGALFKALRSRNLAIRMDDFGTGYSSLSNLHSMPLEAIKLDRSFVQNMKIDGEFAITVQAVVMMAKNRGFKVIAEGIETACQLAQLQALDCDYGQGYYFARPMDHHAATEILKTGFEWAQTA